MRPLVLFVFVSFIGAGQALSRGEPFDKLRAGLVEPSAERQSAVVREVLTGDSVRLEGGQVLRYIGIQSPPLQSAIPLVRKYGNDALQFNADKVAGKKIRIEWGPQIRGDQSELLGYVFLEEGSTRPGLGGTFLNLEILKAGQGKLKILPPNLKYLAEFRKAELDARRKKLGLWKEEPENPYIRHEYIGEKNTRIYYFPTCSELERIPQAQLVTFRSRVEAKAAGYRPCPTCREEVSPY
ncbi:MAG: thermonuclease family protein [Candidatus Omnitrophica bacterium]|nr:thermonuclease family protein [Candidatus Omnitrophota bacterium]